VGYRSWEPPVRFSDFASDILKSTPHLTADDLVVHLQYFDLASEDLKDQWRRFSAEQFQLAADWTIETVKHLAIVNAAGLAGAATLVASGDATNALKCAFGFFALLTLHFHARSD
jgi:hypothetical protein